MAISVQSISENFPQYIVHQMKFVELSFIIIRSNVILIHRLHCLVFRTILIDISHIIRLIPAIDDVNPNMNEFI